MPSPNISKIQNLIALSYFESFFSPFIRSLWVVFSLKNVSNSLLQLDAIAVFWQLIKLSDRFSVPFTKGVKSKWQEKEKKSRKIGLRSEKNSDWCRCILNFFFFDFVRDLILSSLNMRMFFASYFATPLKQNTINEDVFHGIKSNKVNFILFYWIQMMISLSCIWRFTFSHSKWFHAILNE